VSAAWRWRPYRGYDDIPVDGLCGDCVGDLQQFADWPIAITYSPSSCAFIAGGRSCQTRAETGCDGMDPSVSLGVSVSRSVLAALERLFNQRFR
jgi:hypothetical protein